MLTALQLLKEELANAHETFESTAADIKDEHVHKDPGGMAFPLGATYAHLVFSEDAIVSGMLQGKAPLFATDWKDKTGASSPMPAMDENWEKANSEWSKTVQVDLNQMREYAKAVYAATDAYLETLTEEDLEKELDLGPMGKQTVVHVIYSFLVGHANSLAGELSALKGVHGAKGYPF
jgi:uncharacterized damage-inducible protein DinB